jgi:hypothetical protein
MIKDIIKPSFNNDRNLYYVRFTLLNEICYAYFENIDAAWVYYGKILDLADRRNNRSGSGGN